jgi:hypothetical protein
VPHEFRDGGLNFGLEDLAAQIGALREGADGEPFGGKFCCGSSLNSGR